MNVGSRGLPIATAGQRAVREHFIVKNTENALIAVSNYSKSHIGRCELGINATELVPGGGGERRCHQYISYELT